MGEQGEWEGLGRGRGWKVTKEGGARASTGAGLLPEGGARVRERRDLAQGRKPPGSPKQDVSRRGHSQKGQGGKGRVPKQGGQWEREADPSEYVGAGGGQGRGQRTKRGWTWTQGVAKEHQGRLRSRGGVGGGDQRGWLWECHLGNLGLWDTAQACKQLQVLAAGRQLEDGIQLRAVAHATVSYGRFPGHAGDGEQRTSGTSWAPAMLGASRGLRACPPTHPGKGQKVSQGQVNPAEVWGSGTRAPPDPCMQRRGVGRNKGSKAPHLWPASTTSPPLGTVSPVTMWNVDIFPAPFTPSSPKHCGYTQRRYSQRPGHLSQHL